MIYTIILSPTALQEEAEAYLFYERQAGGLGDRFLTVVENTMALISQHPTYYAYTDATKTIRNVALITFPFVIVYEVRGNSVIVYHIHHTKKKLQ